MLSLHWQRKRQPIIIGLLLHLRPQMNSFQNSWLLQEFFFFFLLSILPHPRRHFVASYSIPLCSLWLSIWCWPILKESQLGFLFCYKSSSSHVCLHRGNPSEELDMCLNKQARKKQNKTGTPDICCVWRMSYFINATQRKNIRSFLTRKNQLFGQL